MSSCKLCGGLLLSFHFGWVWQAFTSIEQRLDSHFVPQELWYVSVYEIVTSNKANFGSSDSFKTSWRQIHPSFTTYQLSSVNCSIVISKILSTYTDHISSLQVLYDHVFLEPCWPRRSQIDEHNSGDILLLHASGYQSKSLLWRFHTYIPSLGSYIHTISKAAINYKRGLLWVSKVTLESLPSLQNCEVISSLNLNTSTGHIPMYYTCEMMKCSLLNGVKSLWLIAHPYAEIFQVTVMQPHPPFSQAERSSSGRGVSQSRLTTQACWRIILPWRTTHAH